MGTIDWSVMCDFDRDGTYEFDLLPYITAIGSGIKLKRGSTASGSPKISTCTIEVTNRSDIFTPGNTASDLYGQMFPNVPIQFSSTHDSNDFTHWTGYIREFNLEFKGLTKKCTFECSDIFEDAKNSIEVNVATHTSIYTDDAMNYIAAAVGLASGDVSFDEGIQLLPLHTVTGQDALTAWNQVAQSEMGGFIWVTADGLIRFENRHSRLGHTPDHTWGDGTAIKPTSYEYKMNNLDLIGQATVLPTIYSAPVATQDVIRIPRGAKTSDSIVLEPNVPYTVVLQYGFPVTLITTPVAGTDYLANDDIDGGGTDRTSSISVDVEDLGGAILVKIVSSYTANVYLTYFRVRGSVRPWSGQTPRLLATKSPLYSGPVASGVALQVPFASDTQEVFDYSVCMERTYRYPYPTLQLTFTVLEGSATDDTTLKNDLLALELGELVQYTNADIFVDDLWYVESIEMPVPANRGGKAFTLSVMLSPAYNYRNLDASAYDYFARDDATGDLGTAPCNKAWANDTAFDLVSGKARASSDAVQIPDLSVGSDDMVVEVNIDTITAGNIVGVTFRKSDNDNYYKVSVNKTAGTLVLSKVVAGTVTPLNSVSLTVNEAHELRVIVQGSRIRVWLDYVGRIDLTNTAIASGVKAGLYAEGANAEAKFSAFYSEGLSVAA